MNATIQHQRPTDNQIVKVVLEVIHPRRAVEIDPQDLPDYVSDYGHLVVDGHPAQLSGVRLAKHPEVCSYAGCYWYCAGDAQFVSRWHLYVGVSCSPGLILLRN
jgi:hypothetical protein